MSNMKTLTKNLIFTIMLAMVLGLSFTSCMNDKLSGVDNTTLNNAGFDFKTTTDVHVTVSTLNNSNQPVDGVNVKLYTQNPLNADGTLKADNESYLIYTGTTGTTGMFDCQISPAATVDSLTVLVDRIGLPQLQTLKINSSEMSIVIGGSNVASKAPGKVTGKDAGSKLSQEDLPSPILVNGFYILGSWDNQGVPKYLMSPNDVITNKLMSDLTSTLPEYKSLLTTHPDFLDDTNDGSVKLFQDAEVFVTFVHEGAGYMNTLAYYSYPTNTPPTTVGDIKSKMVVFPNVSFSGSGGGLTSGNKVQLLYLDPVSKKYSNIFPAGTTVGWVLQSMGWSGSTVKTADPNYTFYSDSRFNPESDPKLKKHNVLLNDADHKLLLVSFEDMRRDQGSDNDFNDAVFYATSNPVTAIQPALYKSVVGVVDTDGDGVPDASDDYPTDPTRAHNNYYPALNQTGTLAFEDLWPSKGDYDFNDMVVDYNYNQITNGKNEVVSVDATYTLRAFGASYANGFGVQFNTTPDNIISVTGQKFTENIIKLKTNGTELNQSKAVVMVFDNAQNLMKHQGTGTGVNTLLSNPYVTPVTMHIHFDLKTPVAATTFGSGPYNAFIFTNGDRTKEIHLPKNSPTDLANLNYFGTHDDNTDLKSGNYYMSNKYFPWAINIPVQFAYPIETVNISKAYLNFSKWASSNGTSYNDWYLDKPGYRVASNIYSK